MIAIEFEASDQGLHQIPDVLVNQIHQSLVEALFPSLESYVLSTKMAAWTFP
jgi:hypothetical protein